MQLNSELCQDRPVADVGVTFVLGGTSAAFTEFCTGVIRNGSLNQLFCLNSVSYPVGLICQCGVLGIFDSVLVGVGLVLFRFILFACLGFFTCCFPIYT